MDWFTKSYFEVTWPFYKLLSEGKSKPFMIHKLQTISLATGQGSYLITLVFFFTSIEINLFFFTIQI